jgi:hypothetical protein
MAGRVSRSIWALSVTMMIPDIRGIGIDGKHQFLVSVILLATSSMSMIQAVNP